MTHIILGDLDDPQVIACIDTHRNSALMVTPGDAALAAYLSRLREPDITLWAAWSDNRGKGKLLGIGALSKLADEHGEVRYMHTAEAARRRGVGSTLLGHIIAVARRRRYSRISLETGSRVGFAPARAFYRAHGFVDCGPFGDYEVHPVSVFMTMALEDGPTVDVA